MTLHAFLRRLLPALALCAPLLASARVGEVLFVYGVAHAQAPGGQPVELQKGAPLNEGDHVVTGANGRAQLRMDDGGLIVLRPLSELVVDQFSYAAQPGSAAATQTPRSLMTLVRGGLRAITGTLGKTNPEAYQMRTPVATIGIRGTDYSALYCANDCADLGLDSGLYLGVADGAIVVGNAGGSLDIGKGGYAFVQDGQSAPVESRNAGFAIALANQAARATAGYANPPPPGALAAVIAQGAAVVEAPRTPDVAVIATGGEEGVDLTTGSLGGVPVAYAGALGAGFSATTPAGESAAATDASGAITGYSGATPEGAGRIELDGGAVLDAGRDSGRDGATGLQWGRWSGGAAVTAVSGATQAHPLDDESLHYIAAASASQPELPSTGRADFELIGNTNPTDDAGHVGTLGSASLAADFTARTVDADLSLSFAATSEVWKASARDLALNVEQADFAGDFDTVTVHGADAMRDGSGSLAGFFTGDAQSVLTGAGVSYGLTDGIVNVAGTAAFQVAQPGD